MMSSNLFLCLLSGAFFQIPRCLGDTSGNGTICSPWSKLDSRGVCICLDTIHGLLHCDESGYIDAVQNCACATYNQARNMTEVGFCVYGCNGALQFDYSVPAGYSALPSNRSQWNEVLCGSFRREGTLCGACQNGFYAPAYSFDMNCLQCNNGRDNLWKYILWAFGPLTLFYFVLLFFSVNIVSSRFMGYVFYSQIIAVPVLIRAVLLNKKSVTYIPHLVKFIENFYGIWNLDFYLTYNSGICLQTDTLATLSLDLAVATYPLLLMVITYLMIMAYDNNFRPLVILMKPFLTVLAFFKSNWNIRTSTIDSFVTFTLLSNVKLLSLCIDLLTPVTVYQFVTLQNVSHSRRLYYDTTVEYFGPKHLPYAVMAIVILFIFILLPTLLLTLYPFRAVQKCLNLFPGRFQLFLNTFVDSFQGCYKNGTEPGTRDYRYLSALPFIIRFIMIAVYIKTLNNTFIQFGTIVLVLLEVFIIITDPFKRNFQYTSYNWQMHIICLASFSTCFISFDAIQVFNFHRTSSIIASAFNILTAFLPIPYFALVIVHLIFTRARLRINVIRS